MSEFLQYVPELIAALMGGGWLLSGYRRRHERETHAQEMRQQEALLAATIRDSETKYTREALEIYTTQVVEPIRQELQRLNEKQIRYEEAINRAPNCSIYPDCVVIHHLQKSKQNGSVDTPTVTTHSRHDTVGAP